MQNPDFSCCKKYFKTFFNPKKRQITSCKMLWTLTLPQSNQFALISTFFFFLFLFNTLHKSEQRKQRKSPWGEKSEMQDYLFLTYPISMFSPSTTFAEINNFLHNVFLLSKLVFSSLKNTPRESLLSSITGVQARKESCSRWLLQL